MQGVFDDYDDNLFTYYAVTLEFRDRIVAGIPSDKRVIEQWIMRGMGVTRQDEVQVLTTQTLREIGVNVDDIWPGEEKSFQNLRTAAEAIASKSQTTVFKRNPALGLYIESRQVKAMLRESCNILWPWDNIGWGGKTTVDKKSGEEKQTRGKSPRSYLIETISIEPLNISLGVHEPTGIDLALQHVTGPQGPRSALGYYEYVERPIVSFLVMTLRDRLGEDRWRDLWRYAQQHGVGAKRSQDFGRFKVVRWDKIPMAEARRLQEMYEERGGQPTVVNGTAVAIGGPDREGDRHMSPYGSHGGVSRGQAHGTAPNTRVHDSDASSTHVHGSVLRGRNRGPEPRGRSRG